MHLKSSTKVNDLCLRPRADARDPAAGARGCPHRWRERMEARAEYGGATTPSSFPHSFVPPPFPLQTEHGGGSRSGEEARRGLVAASSSWRSSSAVAASSYKLDPTVGLRPSEEAPSSLAGPASATCDLLLHQARAAHPLPADWRATRHPPPPSAASSPLAARRLLSLPLFVLCGRFINAVVGSEERWWRCEWATVGIQGASWWRTKQRCGWRRKVVGVR